MDYVVANGVARFGMDITLTLTPEQSAPRMRKLDPVLDADGKPVVALDAEKNVVSGDFRPNAVVVFKEGEMVGVDCEPDRLPGTLGIVLKPKGSSETAAKLQVKENPPRRRRKAAK